MNSHSTTSTAHPSIELSAELIRFASVHPEDGGAQEHLIARLEKLGFTTTRVEKNNTKNFWAELGSAGPLFAFAGHTDVVPPGDASQWTSPPYEPTIREGRLYGRGAADMKCAVAASVVAIEEFLAIHKTPPFRLGFLIAGDEEIAGGRGTADVLEVLESRGTRIDMCIVGEPSSHHAVGDMLRTGRRGSLTGKITIHGVQGHSAYPELAKNPIHGALAPLLELAQSQWDGGDEVFPPTIFQITNIKSGAGAVNVIPASLEALFNVRFSPEHSQASIEERCHTALQKSGYQYDLECRVTAHPFRTPKGALTDTVVSTIRTHTGLTPELNGGGGTSDARFIAQHGAQVLELGVTHQTAHKVDEHVALEKVITLTNLYREILVALVKGRAL